MAFSGEYMVPIQDAQKLERDLAQSKEANAGLMRACEQLERELADMTKHRDALAEALREIASGAYSWKTCVDVIAPKALAATKGGSHE
jgi:hypothetical protein